MKTQEYDNTLRIYLREIGQIPLLTREEENRLAARIKRGDKKARDQMIKANLRLVVKIAHDYANCGLPLLDLINEGNIGLMKAVKRFDPKKGAKFSTYGAWWIKQSIKRALANQSKTIRLPVHIVDKIGKMKRVGLQISEETGLDATDEEIAEEMGMTRAKVAHLRTVAVRPASLNAPVGDEDAMEFGEIIGDESAQMPDEVLRSKLMRADVKNLLGALDKREATILSMRFGLENDEPKTLEEVGKKFRITRERVRQIQNIALRKLRKEMEK
jgi:RNA polymerase primary sigma factor